MVIETVTSAERDAIEKLFHVGQRRDRHAAFAHFSRGHGVISVVAHQRRQIERDGKARLPLLEQVSVAAIGFSGRCEAGELAHRPNFAAIHIAMNAARVGIGAGLAEILSRIEIAQTLGCVNALDWRARKS